jgi:hypothetical protein
VEDKQLAFRRPELHWGRASVALAEGRYEEAAELLTLAATEAHTMGMARVEWRLRLSLAEALEAFGDAGAATAQREASRAAAEALAGMIVDPVRESFVRTTALPRWICRIPRHPDEAGTPHGPGCLHALRAETVGRMGSALVPGAFESIGAGTLERGVEGRGARHRRARA